MTPQSAVYGALPDRETPLESRVPVMTALQPDPFAKVPRGTTTRSNTSPPPSTPSHSLPDRSANQY